MARQLVEAVAILPHPDDERPVSEAEYRERAVAEDVNWEWVDGRLREKPLMSVEHNRALARLVGQLIQQLDQAEFEVRTNSGRVRLATGDYLIPDVIVVPTALVGAAMDRPLDLEAYGQPLPFLAEVWSPSTGKYDIEGKLPAYRAWGDAEIWLLHPFDRVLRAWRRRPDGGYDEAEHRSGKVPVASLPGVEIDLDALWA